VAAGSGWGRNVSGTLPSGNVSGKRVGDTALRLLANEDPSPCPTAGAAMSVASEVLPAPADCPGTPAKKARHAPQSAVSPLPPRKDGYCRYCTANGGGNFRRKQGRYQPLIPGSGARDSPSPPTPSPPNKFGGEGSQGGGRRFATWLAPTDGHLPMSLGARGARVVGGWRKTRAAQFVKPS
jgi:hypothetical protein